jgi:hypothetical protein
MDTQLISVDTLIDQVQRLDERSLNAFLSKVNSIYPSKFKSKENPKEKLLLKKIYAKFAPDKLQEISRLQEKLNTGTITQLEHKQLIQLLDLSSKYDIQRLHALAELAQIRSTSVPKLITDLGLTQAEI